MDLLAEFKKKNLRALSRLISLSEDQDPSVVETLSQLYPAPKQAPTLGLTGVPGAGKSTLTNAYIEHLRKKKETVAVVAVDPVSPFTGGALLGDRIRLSDHFDDGGVFIRSLSTRGKLGGLSLATREVVHLCESFGFDRIVIETVGVGQSEVDIHRLADLTTVVVGPEMGDSIQTLKAGVLEIADLFVVHKADRPGADKVSTQLESMLKMAGHESKPVLMTSIKEPESLASLFQTISSLHSEQQDLITERRKAQVQIAISELIEATLLRETRNWVESQNQHSNNPYSFVQDFFKKHPTDSIFPK